MSLATTIGAGTLLGGLLAVGVYSALAPADAVPASTKAGPTYAPVPTRTVEVEAKDCVGKAVLEGDECVLHVPGPTVTIPATQERSRETVAARAPGTSGTTSAPTYQDSDSQGEDESGDYEDQNESEDESHEDGEHEDGQYEDHEDEHSGDGEYDD
jgi:hypothetical protein